MGSKKEIKMLNEKQIEQFKEALNFRYSVMSAWLHSSKDAKSGLEINHIKEAILIIMNRIDYICSLDDRLGEYYLDMLAADHVQLKRNRN